jgi:hypothetical protein
MVDGLSFLVDGKGVALVPDDMGGYNLQTLEYVPTSQQTVCKSEPHEWLTSALEALACICGEVITGGKTAYRQFLAWLVDQGRISSSERDQWVPLLA